MTYTKEIKQAIKKATSINIRAEFGRVTLEINDEISQTTLELGSCDKSFFCFNSTYSFTGIGLTLMAILRNGDELKFNSYYDEKHFEYIELRVTRKDKHVCDIPFHFNFK